jgi:DNA polymerase-3 subunit alpha
VRQFAKRKIEDLIDSREPQLLAAILSDLRIINGNRGKLIIFKLDDKTDVLEASVDEATFNTNRNLLKDDELVIVQGTLQGASERFGRRFKVTQVWDLETARCKFGKYLRVAVNGSAPDISRLVRDFPPRREMSDQGEISRGLPVRLSLRRQNAEGGATAELHLGESAKFFPTDAALASWMAQADRGLVQIVYE